MPEEDSYLREHARRAAELKIGETPVVKAYFESSLPRYVEIYNNFHALIVVNAKEHCRKKAVCEWCPLLRLNCRKAGLAAER